MGRKNHRGARPQRRRQADLGLPPLVKGPKPPPIEKTIMPHGRCHQRHQKLKFTEAEAPQALKQAQALRKSRGLTGHMEKRVYECKTTQGGCGFWHLTSREQFEERA